MNDIKEFNKLFEYKDGELYWKIKPANNMNIGEKAGCLTNSGYYRVKIKTKSIALHNIIFAMHNNEFCKYIDHKDNNPLNNKIENLRKATNQQNSFNRKCRSKSGIKNVYWKLRQKKWVVELRINGKLKNFGYFKDLELAQLVAIEARNLHHKEFANHD